MKFFKYEQYKNSGIPWAAHIPSHWTTQRTKHLFSLRRRPVREEDGIVTAFRDGEVSAISNPKRNTSC